MNKSNLIGLGLIIVLFSTAAYSQSKDTIKNFDDICFCSVNLAHPMTILNLDNNMEILFALKEGKTLHALDKLNVKYTQSQLKLMELSRLIEKKDSIYKTRIPIL